MKFEYKIKNSFRAVELLLYIPKLKESPSLEKNVLIIGREYYFVTKKIDNNFIYYHINTSEASGTFGRIIALGIQLREFLLKKYSLKDFLIYSFSRVLQKDKPISLTHYKERIFYLYKNTVLRSLFFVDNHVERAMYDDFNFKKITEREFLLKGRKKEYNDDDLFIPVFVGRDKEIEEIKSVYQNICGSLKDGTWIEVDSINPNLIGIKAAPGVGKTSFIKAFLADISYFYSGNFYVISRLTRNNGGPFHPFLVMLSEFLDFSIYRISEEKARQLVEKKVKFFSQFLNEADIKNYRMSLEFIYNLIADKIDEYDDVVEKFSLALQGLFSALIKKDFVKEQYPYIFVFEDIHLYSKKSHFILEFILKNFCMIKPALFILTYSYNFDAKSLIKYKLNEIILDVFDREKTELFAKTFLNTSNLPRNVINDLYLKSCGHPFYIERYLIRYEQGKYSIDDDTNNINFPENIQTVISGKIHYIPEYLHFILQLASIIGKQFDIESLGILFEKILNEPFDINLAIVQLIKFEIIGYDDENIFFLTPFYKTAIYETILLENRKYFHDIYAGILEEKFKKNLIHDPMLIAENYFRSYKPEKGILYLVYKIEERLGEYKIKSSRELINYGLKKVDSFKLNRKKNKARALLYLTYSSVLAKLNKKRKEKKLLDTIEKDYLPLIENPYVEIYYKLQLAFYYYSVKEYKESYNLANEVLGRFEKDKDRIHLVEALLLLGQSAYFLRDPRTALSFYNRIPQHNPTHYQLGKLNYLRGKIYLDNCYLTKSISFLTKSYDFMKSITAKSGFFLSGRLLGKAYFNLGDYDNAYKIFLELLDKAKLLNCLIDQFYSFLYCGKILFYKNNLAKAEELLNNAFVIAKQYGVRSIYIEILLELVEFYIKSDDIKSASMYLDIVFSKLNEDSSTIFFVRANILRALIFLLEKKYENCLEFIEKGLELVLRMDVDDINKEKEILLYRIFVILDELEKNNITLEHNSNDIYQKSLDFTKEKLSKIDGRKQKLIYRQNHYYIAKIINREKSLF